MNGQQFLCTCKNQKRKSAWKQDWIFSNTKMYKYSKTCLIRYAPGHFSVQNRQGVGLISARNL